MYGPHESPEVLKNREGPIRYSCDGESQAAMREVGELAFSLRRAGAGVAFPTGWGDEVYPVYLERNSGRAVRVFINVG